MHAKGFMDTGEKLSLRDVCFQAAMRQQRENIWTLKARSILKTCHITKYGHKVALRA